MRLEDLLVAGEPRVIGSYEFTAERIVEFAREFDPHPFHVDALLAKESLFGNLCASGWHMCAAAMKCNVAWFSAEARRLTAEGIAPPKLGPSPGFRNLKWMKPAFAGDTLTFSMALSRVSAVPNRPGRYVAELTFEGVNQRGDTAIRFDCSVVEFE